MSLRPVATRKEDAKIGNFMTSALIPLGCELTLEEGIKKAKYQNK